MGWRSAKRIDCTKTPKALSWSPILVSQQTRSNSTTPTTPPMTPDPSSVDPALTSSTSFDISGADLLNMPEQLGYLHTMGLDFGWGPTSMMMWFLEHVHVLSGMPWWASIATVTLIVRGAMVLPSLTAQEHAAKMKTLRDDPEFKVQMARLQDAMTSENGPRKQADMLDARMKMKAMTTKAGFKFSRTLVPLIQIPFGFAMYRILTNMAALPIPGLETGGVLWFTDLTVPDPLFILPLAGSAMIFIAMRVRSPSPARRYRYSEMVLLIPWS